MLHPGLEGNPKGTGWRDDQAQSVFVDMGEE